MEYRYLGRSGFRVPVLSFGTGTFGGEGEFFKAWGATDVAQARRLVDICLEAGAAMFDSADPKQPILVDSFPPAAEPIAMAAALPMAVVARVTAPFVWVLNNSSAFLLRIMGVRAKGEHALTAEELHEPAERIAQRIMQYAGLVEQKKETDIDGLKNLVSGFTKEQKLALLAELMG